MALEDKQMDLKGKIALVTGGNSGIGLAISHRLVETHHGVIGIESMEGKGTRVTVRLPKGV